jgi:hypothetical protein
MSTRNPRATTAEEQQNAVLAPLNMLADLPRRQMALAAQSTSAVLRASESLRKVQQQAAHRALLQHEEVAERLRGPCDFNELLSIQAELLRFNMQTAAEYWQQVMTAALKAQSEVVSSAGEVLDAGGEPTLYTLQRAFADSLHGTSAEASSTH